LLIEKKSKKKPFYDWVKMEEGKPPKFELVHIVFDNGVKQPAWWTGTTWDMGKKRRGEEVVAWKRIMTHAAT